MTPDVEKRHPLAFFTAAFTPEGRPTRLRDTVRRTAGTRADVDLLPVDQAPGPADDARTA